jgi:hypothetical protein
MILDRRTLLFAAETAEAYDRCVLCGQLLATEEAHVLHRRVASLQRATQITIAIELRALAATGSDLKGHPRRVAKA